jgi:hypothetical protein
VARSTFYRWLHKIEGQTPSSNTVNETPTEIASFVWEITKANLSWGRIRVANQLTLLSIFLSASTVRNILQRPKPRNTPASPAVPEKTEKKPESRPIPAWYPNHVWSIDTTEVLCWGLWPHDFYYDRKPETPKRDAKTVPANIERHVFTETRLTAYRLKTAA